MDVYLDGQMVDYHEARVGHDDAGFQHAVGLFETMNAQNGRVFRAEAHLQRLAESAKELGLERHLDTDKLRRAVQQTLSHNRLSSARVRLTITGGQISLLRPDHQSHTPTSLVVATEPIQYDPAYFEQGITVQIGPAMANPFDPLAGHKTVAYWSRLRLLRQAAMVDAGEAIVLNVTNHLASGAISNLFLVKDSALWTPYARGEEVRGALAAPVRAGITRAAILELADDHNLTVTKKMLSLEDLFNADEVFLTNSSWQILPVTRVEKQAIQNGKVGPITRSMRTALLDLIDRETTS